MSYPHGRLRVSSDVSQASILEATPTRKRAKCGGSPPKVSEYQWQAGAVRILQKDMECLLQTFPDLNLRIKRLEEQVQMNNAKDKEIVDYRSIVDPPLLALPQFLPAIPFAMLSDLDKFASTIETLQSELSSVQEKMVLNATALSDLDSRLHKFENAVPAQVRVSAFVEYAEDLHARFTSIENTYSAERIKSLEDRIVEAEDNISELVGPQAALEFPSRGLDFMQRLELLKQRCEPILEWWEACERDLDAKPLSENETRAANFSAYGLACELDKHLSLLEEKVMKLEGDVKGESMPAWAKHFFTMLDQINSRVDAIEFEGATLTDDED